MDHIFLPDSITSGSDAQLNYKIKVAFIYGDKDGSSAIREGEYNRNFIYQYYSKSLADAPHQLASVLDAAQLIASEMISNCHLQSVCKAPCRLASLKRSNVAGG